MWSPGKYGTLRVVVALFVLQATAFNVPRNLSNSIEACRLLQESFPQIVSFPGAEQYNNDTEHTSASSTQNATCSIEPTSADDISVIIKIIGRPDIRTPFAVRSGGHAYNLGQSSTPGVQISMARFTNITYNSKQNTVTIGVGLTWGQVYEQLEPLGIMVAGARTNGVGVGGFSLGGGYSWKSNQVGLLIDTIISHELVLPTGEQVHVSSSSDTDLFFALRGGLNNFGIVTEMTLEAHTQTLVYGGLIEYSLNATDALNSATSSFSMSNTDPKAQIITGFTSIGNQFSSSLFLFYDAPVPPHGLFDTFLSIPALSSNVKTRTFVDFMSAIDFGDSGIGLAAHVVPILHYTNSLLDNMVTRAISFGEQLSKQDNGTVIIATAQEPFFNAFSHSRGGAYPHPPSRQVSPWGLNIFYQLDPNTPLEIKIARNAIFREAVKNLSQITQAQAVEEGVSRWDDILYPNYALTNTPLELLYGGNLQRLRQLAEKYDPDRVMMLTGGFLFLD